MPVKYHQRHLRTLNASSKFPLGDREIDCMVQKNIFCARE